MRQQLHYHSREVCITKGTELSNEEYALFDFNIMVSKRLKERRMQLGITQEELAQKSNVSRATIISVEQCKRVATLEVV